MEYLKINSKKISKDEIDLIIDYFRRGKVIVYPTDTIYGLGCNASSEAAVKKIRRLKKRDKKPFSVIAPGKAWITKNCVVSKRAAAFIKRKLPGPYTVILPLKNKRCVAPSVTNGLETLGVRMPKHWFASVVAEAGVPFVTTSVNLSGGKPMTSLKDAERKVIDAADIVVYEGIKRGKPSKKIFFC